MATFLEFLEFIFNFVTNMSETLIISCVYSNINAVRDIYMRNDNIKNFYYVLAPIALNLCFVNLFCVWINKSMDSRTTKEMYLKDFLKFILCCVLIINGYDIMIHLYEFFDSISLALLDFVKTSSPHSISNLSFLSGIIEAITLLSTLLPQFLTSLGYIIVVEVILVKRSIDIGIQIFLSPLSVPSYIMEEKHSDLINFIKNFGALCLQGGVIALTVMISNLVFSGFKLPFASDAINQQFEGIFQTSIDGTLKNIVVGLTMLSFLFKSKRIADDVLGKN